MQHLARGAEDYKYRITETTGIVQTFLQGGCGLVLRSATTWNIYVDILVVLVYCSLDVCVLCDEVGKPQAPDAPVASQLHDDVLLCLGGLGYGLVNLCDRVDFLVVNFGELCLCIRPNACNGKG